MLNLLPNERIYLLKRRHYFLFKIQLLPSILLFLSFLFLTLFFLFWKFEIPQFFTENFPQLSNLKVNVVLSFLCALMLPILWCLIFFEITRYYLTYWVITNQRIIEARLLGFFNVQYSSVSLDKIQDATISIKGILASILKFGSLRIQTASEKGEFILQDIETPEIVKKIIFEAKRDYSTLKT